MYRKIFAYHIMSMSAVLKRISKLFGSVPKKASGLLENRLLLFMLSLICVAWLRVRACSHRNNSFCVL
jgi:hypothetical protein